MIFKLFMRITLTLQSVFIEFLETSTRCGFESAMRRFPLAANVNVCKYVFKAVDVLFKEVTSSVNATVLHNAH